MVDFDIHNKGLLTGTLQWTFIEDFIGARFPTSCPEESRSIDWTNPKKGFLEEIFVLPFFFPSGAAIFVIAFLMKQIIKDRVCYHYRYHYCYRYRCPCDWKPFLKFGRNFRHTAGWFSYVFLRDGPGRGHCLYKQRNTPKQTRLRKALLHYFSREASATRANKEAPSCRL